MTVGESSAQSYELRDPDVRLMLEVRDDNAAAFEKLMLRYQSRLVTVLEHLTGRRDAAEDLAQEVFLRIYRSRKRYVPGSKFSTWLFTIANNVASNARRSRARRKERNITPTAGDDTGAWSQAPLEQMAQAKSAFLPTRQLDKAEMREVVQRALETLNERQRMAVLLCKFEGMSYLEIAETMDMSPQAVKSLLSRARDNLRDVLEAYLERGVMPAGSEAADDETEEATS
ncbi:MAG: sigma-70 family RNA polymerase sigma factor [Planctomycetes bacterium]|nr:sigma-70 family RNA polymerase sigma factor [Planctomycetota bacterium]